MTALPSFTVQLTDNNGTVSTTNNSTVALALTTPNGATITGNSVAASSGVATFGNVKIDKVGTYTLTATSGSLSSAVSNSFNITAGPATHFTVTAPATATSGTAFNNLVVTALDAGNNVATGYTGTVNFTSTDGTATLPSSTTLTNGTGTLSATLRTVGTQTITATDSVTASITGTSGNVTVAAALPTIATISPNQGLGKTGVTPAAVTITGTNFETATPSNNKVSFGGNQVSASAATATQLTVTPPANGGGGLVDVELTNANGNTTLANGYRYVLLPTVSAAFGAANVAAGQTTTLTLTITNPNAVQLNGVELQTAALPANLQTSGSATSTCGGTTNLTSTSIGATGFNRPNGSCTISVNVVSAVGGSYSYTTGAISATGTSTQTFALAGDTATTPAALVVASSNDAKLSGLTVSQGTLDPAFIGTTNSYAVSVPSGTTSLTVSPTTSSTAATVTVNGNTVTSGNASGAIMLTTNPQTITIRVTAQDSSTNDYTIEVTRKAAPTLALASSANPSSLGASVTYTATLTGAVTPSGTVTFKDNGADITNCVAVPVSSSAATCSHAVANGLTHGAHPITAVYSGDTRNDAATASVLNQQVNSTDSTLQSLTISSGTLAPTFSGATTSYTVAVPYSVASVTITPTVNQANATLTIDAATATSGQASGTLALTAGVTRTVTVVVTAQNNAQTSYTIGITRANPAPPVLSAFTASAVGYGSTGNTINALTGTAATNGPMAWAVSKTAGGTFAASAESANGTTNVSIQPNGSVTYSAPAAFRGNDTFYVRASNADGDSNVVAITVPVSNPSLTIGIAGSGTRGTALAAGVRVTATGGTGPYGCSSTLLSGALPSGVALGTDCALTGNPGASGTFDFTAAVTDSSQPTGFTQPSGTLQLVIASPTLSMTPAAGALPGATAGASYTQALTASGGTGPYTYAVTVGSLPAGITLNGATISGVPTAVGLANFTITATDSSMGGGGPYSIARAYSITVATPVIALAPTTLANPKVGVPYTANVTASGGTAGYTYSLTGTPPTGLTLAADGTLSGTPTAGGTFNFTVTARDSTTGAGAPYSGAQAYTVTVDPATIAVAPATLPNGVLNVAYSQPITATGGTSTYSFTRTSGTLPTGLTLQANGTLAGTPTAVGSFTFEVTAQDSSTGSGSPYSGVRQYTVTIGQGTQTITFNSTAPGAASVGGATYTPTATATSGLPVTFMIDASASGVCAITGGVVRFTGTGTCVINASQAGDSTWTPAAQVQQSFTVAAPAAPVVTAPANGATGVGPVPTYSGTAIGSSTVTVYVDGTSIGTTTAAAGGGWTLAGTTLADGVHTVKATVTINTATSADSAINSFTVDAQSPNAPVITAPANNAVTADNTPTITGTAEANATVTVSIDGATAGTATATGGNWSFTAASLADGPHTVSATATDGVGNISTASAPVAFRVDTAAPAAPVVTTPANGAMTTATPVISGTAEANATVTVIIDNAAAGTAAANGSGAWTFNATTLAQGGHTVRATAADAGGNISVTSGTNNFTVDSNPPAAPVITAPASGSVTANNTPVISGTAEANATVTVIIGGATAGTTTATGGGAWTFTPGALADGPQSVTATASDAAGNVSTASTATTFTIDTTRPGAPVIAAPANGATLGSTAPVITGTAEAGATVTVYVDGAAAGIVTATGGNWSYTSAALAQGSHTTRATATDGVGNVSLTSATVNFTIDSQAPAAPVISSPANGSTIATTTPAITGNAEGDATVTISIDGTVVGTATASSGGAWSFQTTAALAAGSHTASAVAADAAGNVSTASNAVTFAMAAPPVAADKTGIAIPYNGTGTAIDLAGSVSGAYTSVTIGTAPSHGTVSLAGAVATYTPAAGYFGADSFTYTATGPGGTSNAATVSVTVAAPVAPVAADRSLAVAYNGTGTTIDLSGAITGVHTAIAVTSGPAHGTASVAGNVVTYTPTAGYFGADRFTYTVTGPGGTSNAATVSIAVATPAAPVAADRAGVAIAYNSTGTQIDLSAAITGVHTSIAVATTPAHGTVSITGNVITYTPVAGHFGADSFTYTATGPGGTSNAATVSLIVANPGAPVAANAAAAVVYNSPGTAIDLSSAITGVHVSVAVATAPAHGTVSITGNVITYAPAAGYFGTDSFTYTATGPGGTSNAATVTLTVAVPAAPMAAERTGVAVVHNSSGTAIDLSSSITGVHASIAISAAPAHGTVTIAGDVVTYKPATGYYGADSFAYTATGPGGTSAAATVALEVAAPPAPVAANASAAVPYDSVGTAIDLTTSVTGVSTGIAIGTAPLHGTVTVTGNVVTYVPAAGHQGADSFTYTATGPGGASQPATVSIMVAAPPPPVTVPGTGNVAGSSSVNSNTSVDIDLSALVTGTYTSIVIATPPAFGTVILRVTGASAPSDGRQSAPEEDRVGKQVAAAGRTIATYRPNPGFTGTDSFTFYAIGPGGRSAAATASINVVGSAPTALPKTAAVGDGQSVTVDLTAGATQGPFTGATIVSVTPASAATTRIVDAGSGATRTFSLVVTPNARYSGTVTVVYTLTNANGTSAPATVTVSVTARPNPAADANVRGVSDAQAETARRFARSQVSNFMRRTEQLHGGGGGSRAVGVTLNSRDGHGLVHASPAFDASALEITERMRPSAEDPMLGRIANMRDARGFRADMLGSGTMTGIADTTGTSRRSGAVAIERPALSEDSEDGDSGERPVGGVAIWSGGAIDIGTQDATTRRSKITATTSGLSAGMDVKLAEGVVLGLGGGYGNDVSRIGSRAARVRSTSSLLAAYASVSPGEAAFVDGMIGVGALDFSTRRTVATLNVNALGKRDGRFTVGALAAGIDRQSDGLSWSLYGRGEFLNARLGAYAETGAATMNLRFDRREISSLTGTLGARLAFTGETGFATVTPRLRAEWNHEFAKTDAQLLDYADIPGASLFSLETQGWSRDQFQLTAGARFQFPRRWSFDLEAGFRGGTGEQAGTLRLQLSKEF